jgi:hypothetical protein
VLIAVVLKRELPEKQEIVKESNEGAESECAEPCDDPEKDREGRQREGA